MDKKFSIKDFLEVKSSYGGTFSPDGSRVAYLSNVTGTQQVFLISAKGGESEQLTDFTDSVSFAYFSPTENQLIFGKAEGGNELTQLYLLKIDTKEIIHLTTKPEVRHDFGSWSPDGTRICFASNEGNGKDFDVYVMNIDNLEKKCVYDGGGWCSAQGFSPKGTYVAIKKNYSNVNTDLYLYNLESGETEHITPHTGNVFHSSPRWLPDESSFFLVQDLDREFMGLSRYSMAEKKFDYVFTPEWDIDGTAIAQNGKCLAIAINEDGYCKVGLYDPYTLEKVDYDFPKGDISSIRFSMDGTHIVFSLGDSRRTTDIWLFDLISKKSLQLTHSHQGVPADVMVEPELIRFKSFDGLIVPAFVFKPKNVSPGTKIPAIINIHGGPESQYKPGYGPITQYLVYNGYAVVAPNVRGSSGYGKTYLSLDDLEKRLDSLKDIVALREHLVTVPEIDTSKLVLFGASYGGFMVLAGLAFYPDLWAAGVDTVGIVNFVTFLENTASYRRALREAEYGSLENDRELLERISPINSIENIKAPLFVIHGANDPRVPLSEAEQVVTKLKHLGREVEFVVYSDEGHGLAKLKNRLDAYPKVIAFLEKVLGTK
jgi:dipeptidyl aminopeptidase/acylaminoacyl peptidase